MDLSHPGEAGSQFFYNYYVNDCYSSCKIRCLLVIRNWNKNKKEVNNESNITT